MNLNPLDWEDQLKLFKERGMDIQSDEKNIKKLQNISYYRLKEFARPLAKTEKRGDTVSISYNGIKFSQVLTRYYQDKNLRINLLHAIEKIEVSLKTKVSFILGNNYGAFGYLNFSNWTNRTKYKKFYVETKQYFFKKNLLKTISRSNHSELGHSNNMKDGFPSVWIAIDLLMFGELVSMIELMSKNNQEKLASFYNCSIKEFLSWIKCLNFIRNVCAHNSNILDIQLQTVPVKRKEWEDYIFWFDDGRSTNRLSIVIFIIIELVSRINPTYRWHPIIGNLKSIVKSNHQNAVLIGFRDSKSPNQLEKYITNLKKQISD